MPTKKIKNWEEIFDVKFRGDARDGWQETVKDFICSLLSQARKEGMVEGYSKGHDKGYLEGCEKLPASYQKGRKEGYLNALNKFEKLWVEGATFNGILDSIFELKKKE